MNLIESKNHRVYLLVVLLLLFITPANQAYSEECVAAESNVKITVSKISATPPFYLFEVSNNYISKIVDSYLWMTDKPFLQITSGNPIVSIGTPFSWYGRELLSADEKFIAIHWTVLDLWFAVESGKSLGSFALMTNDSINISNIPFRVDFEANSAIKCMVGTVVEKP